MPLDCRFFVTCHFFRRLLIVATSSFFVTVTFRGHRRLIIATFATVPVAF